jgi:hypothetical protein
MSRSKGVGRGLLDLVVLATCLIILVALPTQAAEPSASPSGTAAPTEAPTTAPTESPAATEAPATAPNATAAPAATAEPDEDEDGASGKPEKSPKAPKAAKAPEVEVTITGTVATRTDADGNTEYTTVSGGKTLVLDAGPSWFHGANHPLKPFVGKRVTITGSQRAGEDEVDVEAVNGSRLRAAGKPAWAGGWKRVGEQHPGWTQEKWDRWQTKAAGKAKALGTECFPPGQCKDKPGNGGAASDEMTSPDAGG